MRVRLFHTLPGEGRTSMEVYARELAGGLQRVAADSVRLSHWYPDSRLRRATRAVRPLARLAGYLDRYVAYHLQVRGRDADVNHIIDHGYGHLAFSLDPRRTVVTFHDAMLLKLRARELRTDVYPRLTMLGHDVSLAAIRRVARVVADSESSRADLLRFLDYPPQRVHVVPLGVSPVFHPLEVSPRDGTLRILHVGHCAPYKNVEGLLRALPLISRQLDRPVQLVKVGGPFAPAQQALVCQLGLQDQVQHLGMVPLSDLPRVYAEVDLLLMPSLYEGFGLPALEAMACGTPVVVSNQGSLPEVVGDAGLQVDPTDIRLIADAAARVLGTPTLQAELRRKGIERADAFTWERTARAMLAVYREIFEDAC